MTIAFDFEVLDGTGSTVQLRDYEGRVLLIVNVASKCGLTPQYEGLEALYRRWEPRGLTVLGFPCNQFLEQEPGTNSQIQEFCRLTYDVTFPIMGKVNVNGPEAHPLFEFLRNEDPGDFGPAYGSFYETITSINPGVGGNEVKWNFTKFLVDRDGLVLKRYEPPIGVDIIERDVEKLL